MSELRKAREAFGKLESQAEAAEKELASLRAGAADRELAAVLEGVDGGPARARIAELQEMLAGLAPAKQKMRERIGDTIRRMQSAKAEAVRTDARKLQEKLDSHLAEVGKRLAAVRELEGCDFMPDTRAPEQLGEMGLVTRTGVEILARVTVPRSQIMREEIAGILARADTIEQTRVRLAGSITGGSLSELLAAAARPEVLAPGEQAIRQWFTESEGKAEAERARIVREDFAEAGIQSNLGTIPHVDLITTYRLVWGEDGRIDRRQSRFDVSGYQRPVPAKVAELPAA